MDTYLAYCDWSFSALPVAMLTIFARKTPQAVLPPDRKAIEAMIGIE